jgi:hypothetical protein
MFSSEHLFFVDEFCVAIAFSGAITAPLCSTWHLVVCAVPHRCVAMETDTNIVLATEPLTEHGLIIVWQVSLYRIDNESTIPRDLRDVSIVHSSVMEAAFQTQLGQVTLPAPELAPDVQPTDADRGDWVVEFEQWTQVNTQTMSRRHVRRNIITGPR